MNKLTPWIIGVVITGMLAGTGSAWAEGGTACYVVKTMGFDRKIVTEMMPEADFKALEKTIKLEQQFFPKAVALAGKDWRADEMNKKIPFPGNMLKARTIMASQKFPSAEKAGEQMTKYENQEAKKAERQAELEKNSRGRGATALKDSKKEGNIALAIDLVKAKVDALVAGGGSEPGAAGPAEAGGAKVEADAKKDKAVK
ncbi:MAG: hypothetical protein WCL49_03650 [bacterium]